MLDTGAIRHEDAERSSWRPGATKGPRTRCGPFHTENDRKVRENADAVRDPQIA
jgi:hypothetical protein